MKRETVIHVCGRCPYDKEVPSVIRESYSVNGENYEIDLCKKHHEQFVRELGIWTRLSEQIEKPARDVTFNTEYRERAKKSAQLRELAREAQLHAQAEARAIARAQEISEEEKAAAEKRMSEAEQAYELRVRQSIPNAMHWGVTDHARQRMLQRGFELDEVLRTATAPEHTHAQPWRGHGLAVYTRGKCRIVVNTDTRSIITVVDRFATLETEETYTSAHPNNNKILERTAL